MNLRNLETDWIDIDDQYERSLNLKKSLLKKNERSVFLSTSPTHEASLDTLTHILNFLPAGIASRKDNIVHNRINTPIRSYGFGIFCLQKT